MPIFDQGYQHWEGSLTSHAWRWWVITKHGVRTQLRSRWTRIILLFAMVPALGLVSLMVLWGMLLQNTATFAPIFREIDPLRPFLADPKSYTNTAWTLMFQYYFWTQLYICMFLVVLIGPGLISQDLRYNALPLYFSRPLTRADYFFGKLGVIGVFLSSVAILPAILAYLCGIAFSFDWDVFTATMWLIPATIAYGSVIVVTTGMLILAFSSLSRNSRYVGGMWIGFWLLTSIVSSVLTGIHVSQAMAKEWQAEAEYEQKMMEQEHERELRMRENGPPDDFEEPQRLGPPPRRGRRGRRLRDKVVEAAYDDWRPALSFTGNLKRVQRLIFQPDAAWHKASALIRPGRPEIAFKEYSGPNFPWYWSVGILLGLVGLSIWILNRQVQSLDRLR